MRRSGLAVAAAMAVAACGTTGVGLPLVHSEIIETAYMPEQVSAAGPVMPLEMRGTPPGGGTAAAVAEGLHLPPRFGGQPLEPVAAPTQGQRMVLVFAPSGRFRVCEPDAVTGGPSGPETRAVLAYCDGRTVLSSAMVEGPAVEASDPAFADLFNAALRKILPRRNPNFDSVRPRRVSG